MAELGARQKITCVGRCRQLLVTVPSYPSFLPNVVLVPRVCRYKTPFLLSSRTDVVVAHQWDNELSYTLMDVLHANYPLVHNSPALAVSALAPPSPPLWSPAGLTWPWGMS